MYRKTGHRGSAPREIVQCSFDIVGSQSLVSDTEAIKVLMEILEQFTASYSIRINHTALVEVFWLSMPQAHLITPAARQEISGLLSQVMQI